MDSDNNYSMQKTTPGKKVVLSRGSVTGLGVRVVAVLVLLVHILLALVHSAPPPAVEGTQLIEVMDGWLSLAQLTSQELPRIFTL